MGVVREVRRSRLFADSSKRGGGGGEVVVGSVGERWRKKSFKKVSKAL
jgi:hypothetical protein